MKTMSRTVKTEMPLPKTDGAELRPEVTEALLADITRRIVEAFHPYRVILFGSYAYGTPHKDSDIDLLVILDSEEAGTAHRGRMLSVAGVRSVPIDILVYTPVEIETRLAMGDFFIREILEKGRVLYESETPWEKVEVCPTMTLLEEWIEKAEADYEMAVDLNRRRNRPVPDGVCFHCQQCAEKYLKAYLIHQGDVPDRTHNLEDLLNDCVKHDPTLTARMPEAQELNRWSVDPRYPGMTATVDQAKEAMTTLRALRRTLREKLGL